MFRRLAAALGVTAIVLSAFIGLQAQDQSPSSPKSTIIQKVIVKVNGEIFTQNELEREQISSLRQRSNRRLTAADLADAALQKTLGEITPDLLIGVIDELLLVQRGRELGAKITEAQFRNALDQIKKSNNLDDAGLEKALAQEGMTMGELRQQIERQFYVTHVQREEISPQIHLTEAEARRYYKEHPNEFVKPSTVTVRELFIAAPDGSEAAQQAALAKLKAAVDRVAKGEDFAEIVAQVSESATKSTKGLIENVTVDVINPDFRAALDKIQPGGLTEPIKTDTGYVVFKLESRTAPEPLPFEQVVDQITQKIGSTRMDAAMDKHIAKLRAQAIIEWKDEGYKQMYERRLAEIAKGEK
jgi:peptidyl-prolyl cis-trans isomerase SurA